MPLIKPKKDESRKKFIPRCMGDSEMAKEFKEAGQRYAVCVRIWENKDKEAPAEKRKNNELS